MGQIPGNGEILSLAVWSNDPAIAKIGRSGPNMYPLPKKRVMNS